MELTIETVLNFGITLLSILNPLGAIPTFLTLTHPMTKGEIKVLSSYCSLTVMATIALSLGLGRSVLSFFGISIASFTIGGGLLLAMNAFNMLAAKSPRTKLNPEEVEAKLNAREIGVVPLAIPLLSGPGSISTCIIHAREMTTLYHWLGCGLVVVIIGLIVKLVFSYSRPIGQKMGTVGLNIMTRIMGIILLSSAIEMIIKGVREVLPTLKF